MNQRIPTAILVMNCGSSSVKFRLYERESLQRLVKGKIINITSNPLFIAVDNGIEEDEPFETKEELSKECSYKDAIDFILNWVETHYPKWPISVAAHRVVHGGTELTKSVIITPAVMAKLKTLCPLVPLHQPHNLSAIELLTEFKPDITQVACFDTAFHAHHSRLFTEYALPKEIRTKGVRRFGFHGLSYEWLVFKLRQTHPNLLKGRIIAAHLGNGASLCAIENGVSIDTTMGMSALDGIPMGTRCGSLDPGAILYMQEALGLSLEKIKNLLYKESGLKGLSNWTNDVRLLEESQDEDARFAIDYFCLKAAQYIAMMAVSLKGVDALVFTGGIGENSALIREKIMSHLEFLNPFAVHIIKANEEKIMAIEARQLIEQ